MQKTANLQTGTSPHPRILIMDGEQRSALAVTRSLGARGVPVVVASADATAIAGRSRFAEHQVVIPDPTVTPGAALAELRAICARENIQIIFPMTDVSTMLLQRESWPETVIAAPHKHAYEAVSDKAKLLERARHLGIPTPKTEVTRGRQALDTRLQQVAGPVVLKPARSRYFSGDRIMSTSVIVEPSAAAALARADRAQWLEDMPCLVQEFIPGHGAGVFSLYSDSGSVADFAHRRLREKPPRGGVSVLSESAPLQESLKMHAHALLGDAGWRGPAMVEFKVAADGRPYLMEINGRFWGSLQLAIDSGVDFPWLWYQIATGSVVEPVNSYRIPQRLRWLLGDFDSLLLTLRDHETSVSDKMRSLVSFMNFFQANTRFEVLRTSDMRPFLQEIRNWVGALGGGRD